MKKIELKAIITEKDHEIRLRDEKICLLEKKIEDLSIYVKSLKEDKTSVGL